MKINNYTTIKVSRYKILLLQTSTHLIYMKKKLKKNDKGKIEDSGTSHPLVPAHKTWYMTIPNGIRFINPQFNENRYYGMWLVLT